MDSDLKTLQEAVRAIAEALELIPKIYTPVGSGHRGLDHQKFLQLVETALAKTSDHP